MIAANLPIDRSARCHVSARENVLSCTKRFISKYLLVMVLPKFLGHVENLPAMCRHAPAMICW
jgi:hypothetical protein